MNLRSVANVAGDLGFALGLPAGALALEVGGWVLVGSAAFVALLAAFAWSLKGASING